MRYVLILLFSPAVVGCVMDDAYEMPPPPPPMYYAPAANACSGSNRPISPMVAMPQTQEPPR